MKGDQLENPIEQTVKWIGGYCYELISTKAFRMNDKGDIWT